MNDRIKKIRKKLSMTQKEFAEKLGLTKNYISLVETGQRNLSDQSIKVLCTEFNINEEWLRTGKGDMFIVLEDKTAILVTDIIDNTDSPFYSSVLRMMKNYKELDPKSQDVIDDFFENAFP